MTSTKNEQREPLSAAERNAWTKAYRFFEKWNQVHTDEEWLALAKSIGEMPVEDQCDELFQRLVCCCIDFWNDRQHKEEEDARNAAEQTVMTDESGRPVTF